MFEGIYVNTFNNEGRCIGFGTSHSTVHSGECHLFKAFSTACGLSETVQRDASNSDEPKSSEMAVVLPWIDDWIDTTPLQSMWSNILFDGTIFFSYLLTPDFHGGRTVTCKLNKQRCASPAFWHFHRGDSDIAENCQLQFLTPSFPAEKTSTLSFIRYGRFPVPSPHRLFGSLISPRYRRWFNLRGSADP